MGRLGRLGRFGALKVNWPKSGSMTKTTFYFRSFAGPGIFPYRHVLFLSYVGLPEGIGLHFCFDVSHTMVGGITTRLKNIRQLG